MQNGKTAYKPVKILFTFFAVGKGALEASSSASRSGDRSSIYTPPRPMSNAISQDDSSFPGGRGDTDSTNKLSEFRNSNKASGSVPALDRNASQEAGYGGTGEICQVEGAAQSLHEEAPTQISRNRATNQNDNGAEQAGERNPAAPRDSGGTIRNPSVQTLLKNGKKKAVIPEDMAASVVCFHKDHDDSDNEDGADEKDGDHEDAVPGDVVRVRTSALERAQVRCVESPQANCEEPLEALQRILSGQGLLHHRPMTDPAEHVVVSDDEDLQQPHIERIDNQSTRSDARDLATYMEVKQNMHSQTKNRMTFCGSKPHIGSRRHKVYKRNTQKRPFNKLIFCGFRPGMDLRKKKVTDSLKIQLDRVTGSTSSTSTNIVQETKERGPLDRANYRVSLLGHHQTRGMQCETLVPKSPFDTSQLHVRHSILRMRTIAQQQHTDKCMRNHPSSLKVICTNLDKLHSNQEKPILVPTEGNDHNGSVRFLLPQPHTFHLAQTPSPSQSVLAPITHQQLPQSTKQLFPQPDPARDESELLRAVKHFVVRKEHVTLSDNWQSVISLTFTLARLNHDGLV